MFGVRPNHEFANVILCAWIANRPKQGEVAPITVHGELTRRERDSAAVAVAPPPDGESDQLQAIEWLSDKVQFGVGEFLDGLRSFVAKNLHGYSHGVLRAEGPASASGHSCP